MHEASISVNVARKPFLPVRLLWKMGLSVFRATRLADARVGRYSMRNLHRYIVRHCVWPYYKRLTRGEVSVRGQRMHLPQDPDSLGFLMGTFEQQTCDLFDRLVEQGMIVVDAGANIGFYSLLAARKIGPAGQVYAFEPEPANFAFLQKNIEINGYTNIRAFPQALTNEKSRVALHMSREGSGSHSLYQDGAVGEDSVEVESISFDEFWEAEGRPRIGFIKMDIEGSEAVALEGMRRFLEATPDLIMITELFPGALRAAGTEPEAFLRKLLTLGFRVQILMGETPTPIEFADMESLYGRLGEEFGINLLCTKSSRSEQD